MAFGDSTHYPQLSGPFSLRSQYIGQPARSHIAATQVIQNGLVITTIKLDTVTFDAYASSFNLGSNCFVPPATGYFDIRAAVALVGSYLNAITYIRKNDVELTRGWQNNFAAPSGGNQALSVHWSDIIFGTPADRFTLACAVNGATAVIPAGTNLSHMTAMQLA